ncbi:MAG: hypothetical protein [Bacteriophage sp.]|nr:MAG: hypothetical protein [Bacteriophage sp.]
MWLLAAVIDTLNRVDAKRATPEMVVTLAARSEKNRERQAGGNKHGKGNSADE